ncbi:MAG TPA: hypothetical protein VEK08_17805 [Planctomycetota bacterium]|nr:hypothetical protein [Planctomycetota bacterium]
MKNTAAALQDLHNPVESERVLVESIGGWQVLAADRRSAAYKSHYYGSNTPLQLLRVGGRLGHSEPTISILTPCRATAGKFELLVAGQAPRRLCCYACVRRKLGSLKIDCPDAREWIVYMILESVGYMEGPAPQEPSRGKA